MPREVLRLYTVLVEGEDSNEPVSDTVRGLLDGHIWLSRKLGSKGHYPAIDVLESLSRLMPEITSEEHRQAAFLRSLLSAYRENEDLISIGAYRRAPTRWSIWRLKCRISSMGFYGNASRIGRAWRMHAHAAPAAAAGSPAVGGSQGGREWWLSIRRSTTGICRSSSSD